MSGPRALIADPSIPVSGAVRQYLEAAGFQVKVVHFLDEAVERIRAGEPELVLAAATSSFDGETLCRKIKSLSPATPVVLLYPPEEGDPEPHAAAAGADSYMVGPLKRSGVVACARAMMRIRTLQASVARLEAELRRQADRPEPSQDFEFFKKVLLMEVKRSRRYRYPVSFLLVAIDRYAERVASLEPAERTAVLTEALGIVASCIRDIDLSAPFGDERFLVFLPHTAREGALIVAGRLRDRLAQLKTLPESTASIGVACYEPGGPSNVSFGSLMKDATEALRKAQSAGGNTIEAGERRVRDRISLG